jgi:hypothetical protein
MSATLTPHSALNEVAKGPEGILFSRGSSVPADGAAGYAFGAIFIKTNGTTDSTCHYVNRGTKASCSFKAVRLQTGDSIVNCTTSTLTVTEALHNGKTIVLDRAAGIDVTLPAAAANLEFEFLVKTTFTGAATIKSATGADIMIGHAIMGNNEGNSVVNWPAVAASTFDTIDMLGTGNSTGGMAGQRVKIKGLAANLWYVEIIGDAAGTEATPFANTVA